jgi:hypothetical protein
MWIPYLSTWEDPVTMLQVFGERYQDGRLAPRNNRGKARRAEDGLRTVGQVHARLGGGQICARTHMAA